MVHPKPIYLNPFRVMKTLGAQSSTTDTIVNSSTPDATIATASVMASASQAINVASIRTHILASLDLQASNYTN